MTAAAPDEARERFARWLSARTGDVVDVTSWERPSGGRSNDTFLVTVALGADAVHEEHVVVRAQPTTTQIFYSPDVLREARVVQGLHGTGVPAPRVRWCEADPYVLGVPFFVMDAVTGRVPLARPSIHVAGWMPDMNRADVETMWRSALDALVAVHAVDWRERHAFLLDGDRGRSVHDHVERLAAWYRWSTDGQPHPITDAALDDVVARTAALADAEPVLVWGDARPGNMIFGPDHRVAAVIDWEVASIGPAEIDVAHWAFFDEFSTSAIGVLPVDGWPDRDTLVERYERTSGRRLEHLELYQEMEELFIATTLIRQADARVGRGLAPPDTRMGHDNTVTQMLARRLGLPVPDLSPDYVAHRGG
jgi:aminoglycoside phosphotransferase (APT) family kinase protein